MASKDSILNRSCGFQLPIDMRRYKNVRARHRDDTASSRTDSYGMQNGLVAMILIVGFKGLGSISIQSDDAVLLRSVDHWAWKFVDVEHAAVLCV
jgi:hypothetical protein